MNERDEGEEKTHTFDLMVRDIILAKLSNPKSNHNSK
jgi:hypothetical protein